MERKIHHGKNIARFRQMMQIKQDALAALLGDDWNQMKISRLEAKEEIDDALLSQLADALKIPVEAIKHFDEDAAVVNIQNNYEGSNVGSGITTAGITHSTINPIDKLIEVMDENKRLYEELLKAKDEQIRLLMKNK